MRLHIFKVTGHSSLPTSALSEDWEKRGECRARQIALEVPREGGETAAGEKCAVVSFLAFETGKKKELIAVYSQNKIFKKYDTHF